MVGESNFHPENFIWFWIVLIFGVLYTLYFNIRHNKLEKGKEFDELYKYVFNKHGVERQCFYVSSKVKRGYENKKQKMYEYLEFKYFDDFGVEKRCRIYGLDFYQIKYFTKAKNGVKMKVFKEYAHIDKIPEEDISNVALEGPKWEEVVHTLLLNFFIVWFVKPKPNKDFAPYYEEFKASDEYKQFKQKQKEKSNKKK